LQVDGDGGQWLPSVHIVRVADVAALILGLQLGQLQNLGIGTDVVGQFAVVLTVPVELQQKSHWLPITEGKESVQSLCKIQQWESITIPFCFSFVRADRCCTPFV